VALSGAAHAQAVGAQCDRTGGTDVTLFEFLSVAISIVLALSAAQLLTNFREVFDPSRRSWVHATWVVHVLLVHVFVWWSMWAFRDVEWNLATFSVVLLPPGVLFVCSSTLVPSNSSSVTSWGEHFFEVRRWFFAARGLFVLTAGFRSWLLLDKPVLESPTAVSIPIFLLCVAGFAIPDRRIHGVLAVVALAFVVFGVSFFRMEAGAR
jgi:hypothetical protein